MDTFCKKIKIPTLADTEAVAQRLAPCLRPQDVLLLKGDLGAGKTAFSRALIRALTTPGEEVPSPTFTLVQTYPLPQTDTAIWHFDLYRLKDPEEAWELGIEEAFSEAISLVEWPDRLPTFPPETTLEITFELLGDQRRLHLRAGPLWAQRLEVVFDPPEGEGVYGCR